jgi:hypothetical protein
MFTRRRAFVFTLKGWNKSAQGNALGPESSSGIRPERALQDKIPLLFVVPFQGEHS